MEFKQEESRGELHQDLPDQTEAKDLSVRLLGTSDSAVDINCGCSDRCGCCEEQEPGGCEDQDLIDAKEESDADDSEEQIVFEFPLEPGDTENAKSPLVLKASEVCYCGNPAAPHKKRGCQRPARNKECEEQTYTVDGKTYTSCLYCHTNPVLKCKTKKGSRQRFTERAFNERKIERDQLAAAAPPGLIEVPTDAELKQHARKDYKEKRQMKKVVEHFCNLDKRPLRKTKEPFCNVDANDYYGLFYAPDMPDAPSPPVHPSYALSQAMFQNSLAQVHLTLPWAGAARTM